MGLTLSHLSALDVTRMLRYDGLDVSALDTTKLVKPIPFVGKRWGKREFAPSIWRWPQPSARCPLDILTPRREGRIRMTNINTHATWQKLPPQSILQIDERASIACPELMFLQMAEVFPLSSLVLLGYELCGNFSRMAEDPLEGHSVTHVPAATSVQHIKDYLNNFVYTPGLERAHNAINYVENYALSAPEAVLATIYSLPVCEAGYGMGPVRLNERVRVDDASFEHDRKFRYPDLMFSFCPIGINYDGNDHLDLTGLIKLAKEAALADGDGHEAAQNALRKKQDAVRAKVVDDTTRNRQLASKGRLVLPATKENLYGWGNLDKFTQQLLACSRSFFGIDTAEYEHALNNTEETRDRNDLLASMLPAGRPWGNSHGLF